MQTNQTRHCGRGWRPQRLNVLDLRFQCSRDADRDWMNFPCRFCGMISLPPSPRVWLSVSIQLPESIRVTKSPALCHATITVYACFPLMFWAVSRALRLLTVLHSHHRSSNIRNFCSMSLSWAGIELAEFCHSNPAVSSLRI
jgi:hypothetical protein